MEVKHALQVKELGPLAEASIEFGDLTILVGPQATGKSIFLQLLKLVVDNGYVVDTLSRYGLTWQGLGPFLDIYLGEGMHSVWRPNSTLTVDGRAEPMAALSARRRRNTGESLYYVPAQRVLILGKGWPRPFSDYGVGDPFVVRDFSEKIRKTAESDLATAGLFPQHGRLKAELRSLLEAHVFRGYGLDVEPLGGQRRLVLKGTGSDAGLPYMVWSAGQREFTPLLLGLYSLLPAGRVARRGSFRWVVIEEPEMGLHPAALQAVLLSILDLLERGYRVCLSTHSAQAVELAWFLSICQTYADQRPALLLDLFGVKRTAPMMRLAEAAFQKAIRVYYFDPESRSAADISSLDPGGEPWGEAFWGGLTAFSGRVAEAVAEIVNTHEGGGS